MGINFTDGVNVRKTPDNEWEIWWMSVQSCVCAYVLRLCIDTRALYTSVSANV